GLDLHYSACAVVSHSGEHDANGVLLLHLREGAEEAVDGSLWSPLVCIGGEDLRRLEPSVDDVEIATGRDHIDVVRPHGRRGVDFYDRHRRLASQKRRQGRWLIRALMSHNHERYSARRGHSREELLECCKTTGGGAQADDDEGLRSRSGLRFFA